MPSIQMNIRLAAGCLVAAMLIAACGGGNGSSSSTPASTQTEAGGQTTNGNATNSPSVTPSSTANVTPIATTATAVPSSIGSLDVCALITNDEMVSIVGPVNAGLRNSISPTEYACEWTAAPGRSVAVGVGVHLNTVDGARAAFQAVTGEPQAGVGDGAIWDTSATTLHVLKGSYIFDISALDLASDSASLTAAEAIAQKMMPRLP